jgi:hypothetical protein
MPGEANAKKAQGKKGEDRIKEKQKPTSNHEKNKVLSAEDSGPNPVSFG